VPAHVGQAGPRPSATSEARETAARVFDEFHRRLAATPTLARVLEEALGEYVGQCGHATVRELRTLAEAARLRPGSRGLDIACGSGGPTFWLAAATGCRFVGVDIAASAIDQARKRPDVAAPRPRFLEANLDAPLPFGRGGFDAVLSIDGVHWSHRKPDLLRECQRVLRRNGRLAFLTTYAAKTADDPRLNQVEPYAVQVPYVQMLAEAGFRDVMLLDLTRDFVVGARAVAAAAARHLRALRGELGKEVADVLLRQYAVTGQLAGAGVLHRAVIAASSAGGPARVQATGGR